MDKKPDFPPFTLDEEIISATLSDKKTRLKIYPYDSTSIVLGRGSDVEKEVNLELAKQKNIEILRRRGGGCSVLLDPGNIILSLTAHVSGYGDNQKHFDAISSWVRVALEKVTGKSVLQRGISDITIGDRKIGGSCLYRKKDFLYYSSTLLISSDITLMNNSLKHPPREPDYRMRRTHSDFVTNISTDSSPKEFCDNLINSLQIENLRIS